MSGGKRLKRDGGRNLYDWVGTVAAVALTAVIIFTFAVRLVLVDGPSMRETLQHGDCLAVLNAPLCGMPEAGDIVILRKESFREGAPIVKRVIATEGQTVDIDFDAGVVYVDGAALEEDYIRQPTYLEEGLDFPVHRAGGVRLRPGGQPQRQRRQPGPGAGAGGHPVSSGAGGASALPR